MANVLTTNPETNLDILASGIDFDPCTITATLGVITDQLTVQFDPDNLPYIGGDFDDVVFVSLLVTGEARLICELTGSNPDPASSSGNIVALIKVAKSESGEFGNDSAIITFVVNTVSFDQLQSTDTDPVVINLELGLDMLTDGNLLLDVQVFADVNGWNFNTSNQTETPNPETLGYLEYDFETPPPSTEIIVEADTYTAGSQAAADAMALRDAQGQLDAFCAAECPDDAGCPEQPLD